MSNGTHDEVLTAPARIVSDNRAVFRKEGLAFLDRTAAAQAPTATLDFAGTEELDASGLGVLVLMQKRAEELEIRLLLANVPPAVRHLLNLTRLSHLFEIAE